VRPFLLAPLLVALLGAGLGVAACSDSSSSADDTQSPVPPANCTEPCAVGTTCFGPAEPACNGTWYCQSDQKWACSPPDAGGPGGFPDGSDESLTGDGPYDASSGTDAPAEASGGKDATRG